MVSSILVGYVFTSPVMCALVVPVPYGGGPNPSGVLQIYPPDLSRCGAPLRPSNVGAADYSALLDPKASTGTKLMNQKRGTGRGWCRCPPTVVWLVYTAISRYHSFVLLSCS